MCQEHDIARRNITEPVKFLKHVLLVIMIQIQAYVKWDICTCDLIVPWLVGADHIYGIILNTLYLELHHTICLLLTLLSKPCWHAFLVPTPKCKKTPTVFYWKIQILHWFRSYTSQSTTRFSVSLWLSESLCPRSIGYQDTHHLLHMWLNLMLEH